VDCACVSVMEGSSVERKRTDRVAAGWPGRWGQALGWVGVVLVITGAGCRPQEREEAPASNVVAVVGGQPITLEAMRQEVTRRSLVLRNKGDAETLLEGLILREAAYAKAKAQGFERQPEVAAAIRRLVAEMFQESERGKAADRSRVTVEEIRSYYRAHPAQYSTPAKRRGAVIFLGAGGRMAPEQRAALESRARGLQQAAERGAGDANGFSELARQYSEDQATRYRGGETGWVTVDPRDSGLAAAVIKALFAIEGAGDLAPLVCTPEGYYVVKLLAIQPATVRSLAEVSEGIRYRLERERTDRGWQEVREAMKAGMDIRINGGLLESVIAPAPAGALGRPTLP
jgi:peptidyl-prolyl cis-trans isomerase C